MDQETPIGQRIRYWRKRRNMSQQVLAGLIGRSAQWLSKVERGKLSFDSISVLLALARVLKVEPGVLWGGISLPPNGGEPHDPPKGIPAIRRAMFEERTAREPLDLATLRADVEAVQRLAGDASYESLAQVLPTHLLQCRNATATQDIPDAWWSLAGAYEATTRLARLVGDVGLASIAADRAVEAARRSGDKLLVATAKRQLALTFMSAGWLDLTAGVCSDTADAIAPTDQTLPEGWALWGSMHLTGAIAAVRAEQPAVAWRLLRDARTAAERIGPGRDDYWQAFGPANVGAHEITVALESRNPAEALQIADTVNVSELPRAERRARFLVDVAHAYVLREDDPAAVGVLLLAERHAPEVVRYQMVARTAVQVCLNREQRYRTPELRGLAARLNITLG